MYICIYPPTSARARASWLTSVLHQYLAIQQPSIIHLWNTLQSPILQFAIYLYCRVHLALLHQFKDVGLPGHRGTQAATNSNQMASNPPGINEHQCKQLPYASICNCLYQTCMLYHVSCCKTHNTQKHEKHKMAFPPMSYMTTYNAHLQAHSKSTQLLYMMKTNVQQKEVGGRNGAYKLRTIYTNIYIYIYVVYYIYVCYTLNIYIE